MADGRTRADWGRMSSLLCLLANVNRDPKRTRPFKPSDFDPHHSRGRSRSRPVSVAKLTDEIMSIAERR